MSSIRQQFLSHLAQTSEFPLMLEVERAEGMYLYDPEEKSYLDLIAGIGVSCLGHRHPKVVSGTMLQNQQMLLLMVNKLKRHYQLLN